MLTWIPIVCLALTALATIICVRCSGNSQRRLEQCRIHHLDARDYTDQCARIFRERRDKLESRGWTNLDPEEILLIEAKVLQTINDNDGDIHALKLAVVEILSEELKAL